MSQERLKIEEAEAALRHVEDDMVLGWGTDRTVIASSRALTASGKWLKGAVSSSDDITQRLEEIGVDVIDLNHTVDLALYIDGADEVEGNRHLIKGGGGALTREKIIAEDSRRFVS